MTTRPKGGLLSLRNAQEFFKQRISCVLVNTFCGWLELKSYDAVGPIDRLSICARIAGPAALNISKNAANAGLWESLRHETHNGIRADCGVIARIVACGRFKLRTQLGMSETPRFRLAE